jgi:Fur family zinc uptake transcriptional regulator
MSAYEVMKAAEPTRPWAPPTVYRALNRLIAERLVHRIESINGYIACAHDHHSNAAAVIAICRGCGSAQELPEGRIYDHLKDAAAAYGFQIAHTVIEVTGHCVQCADRRGAGPPLAEGSGRELTRATSTP